MYHSYARVPGSELVPETISSISSLNVSSAPSLIVSSLTQETCPMFIAQRPENLRRGSEGRNLTLTSTNLGSFRPPNRAWHSLGFRSINISLLRSKEPSIKKSTFPGNKFAYDTEVTEA